MTIATLILTCMIFVALGWTGDVYAPIALCVGAIVCIAAANAGATSQDLKTGYIVGATPLYQQIGLVIGVITSAFVIGMTTLYLHQVFGIGSAGAAGAAGDADGDDHQGPARARTCRGAWCWSACSSRSRSSCAASTRCRSRSGSYLPIATTAPIFVGGLVRWWVERKTSVGGIGAQRRHALQLGPDCRRLVSGILFAILVGHRYHRPVPGDRRASALVPR